MCVTCSKRAVHDEEGAEMFICQECDLYGIHADCGLKEEEIASWCCPKCLEEAKTVGGGAAGGSGGGAVSVRTSGGGGRAAGGSGGAGGAKTVGGGAAGGSGGGAAGGSGGAVSVRASGGGGRSSSGGGGRASGGGGRAAGGSGGAGGAKTVGGGAAGGGAAGVRASGGGRKRSVPDSCADIIDLDKDEEEDERRLSIRAKPGVASLMESFMAHMASQPAPAALLLLQAENENIKEKRFTEQGIDLKEMQRQKDVAVQQLHAAEEKRLNEELARQQHEHQQKMRQKEEEEKELRQQLMELQQQQQQPPSQQPHPGPGPEPKEGDTVFGCFKKTGKYAFIKGVVQVEGDELQVKFSDNEVEPFTDLLKNTVGGWAVRACGGGLGAGGE